MSGFFCPKHNWWKLSEVQHTTHNLIIISHRFCVSLFMQLCIYICFTDGLYLGFLGWLAIVLLNTRTLLYALKGSSFLLPIESFYLFASEWNISLGTRSTIYRRVDVYLLPIDAKHGYNYIRLPIRSNQPDMSFYFCLSSRTPTTSRSDFIFNNAHSWTHFHQDSYFVFTFPIALALQELWSATTINNIIVSRYYFISNTIYHTQFLKMDKEIGFHMWFLKR
ncbi:hypothetical protein ACJX0J_023658, partial [Zea mays]